MILTFGDCELDDERFELRRAGQVVALQPKALAVLFHLVRNSSHVVSKQELLGAVWPDTVVTAGSLARAVSLARVAISDRNRKPIMIVSVARRGYQFRTPVQVETQRPCGPHRARTERDPASNYVGRVDILARLTTVLETALTGRGRILLLTGEAGIGKTRTAELLAERARGVGAEVATAWGLEDSAAPTYWTWTRIFRALAGTVSPPLSAREAAELAWLVPELSADTLPQTDCEAQVLTPENTQQARYRHFEAAQSFLTRAARQRPLALFLDDLHWADAESLWLVEFLGHALGSLPIAIVATCREDESGRSPERARALERVLRLITVERWPLCGLHGPELWDFVRLCTGSEPASSLVQALERKTGGNPLFLQESLRSLAARGLLRGTRDRRAWEALLPPAIQHLVRHKVRHLSTHAMDVLSCAAGIGTELDRAVLAHCVTEGTDLATGLREAEEIGFLFSNGPATPTLRFSHVLVREALYDQLVPPGLVRSRLHARIMSALETSGDASEAGVSERARHACEAVPLVDARRASELAQAAGSRAARLHDFESAAYWYQRALDVLGSNGAPEVRVELWLGLAAAQARASGLEGARITYQRAAKLARSISRGDFLALAALGYASRPTAAGHGDPAVVHLLEEASHLVPPAFEALRIRVLSRLAGELRYADSARARKLVEQSVAAARILGEPAALAQALDDSSFLLWSPANPERWIALNVEISRAAQSAGDLELALQGEKGRVTGLLEIGDFVAVDAVIETCERMVGELRTPYARWFLSSLQGMRALLDGRLADAERQINESVPLGERAESPEVSLELASQLVYLRLEQGRASEVEAAARAQVERFPDVPAWRAALGRILMAEGRLLEARHELERLAEEGLSDLPRDRGWLPTLVLAAEIAHASGATSRTEQLEELLAPYDRLCVVAGSGLLFYGSVSHHLGLLAASQSRWEAAIQRFEIAERVHERAGARIWAARSRLGSARALLGRGRLPDRRHAAGKVAAALAVARPLGLTQIESEAQDLDRSLHARPAAAPGSHPRR